MSDSSGKAEARGERARPKKPKFLDLIKRYGLYPHEIVNPKIDRRDVETL